MDVLGDNEDDAVEELNMPVDFPLINKDKVMDFPLGQHIPLSSLLCESITIKFDI